MIICTQQEYEKYALNYCYFVGLNETMTKMKKKKRSVQCNKYFMLHPLHHPHHLMQMKVNREEIQLLLLLL
jgi:hypothetical protein